MITLGLISPDPSDAVSFFRAFGVFPYLARNHDVRFVTGANWGWEHIVQCDVVFFQRPFSVEHKTVCEMVKSLKVPLWIDVDDDLFSVPMSNPAHPLYMTTTTHANMRAMIGMADVVTVTTKTLAERFMGAQVIPNAMNDYIWEMNMAPREKVVSWRGSVTHFADMAPFLPAIQRASEKYPDWMWSFVGHPHWDVVKAVPHDRRRLYGYAKNFFEYVRLFNSLNPSVHIVTLDDCPFNHAKSNLAWLEATMAGAVVVAPDWEEWHRPGIVNYKNGPDGFDATVGAVMEQSPGWLMNQSALSREFITRELLLSDVNEMRWSILRELSKK